MYFKYSEPKKYSNSRKGRVSLSWKRRWTDTYWGNSFKISDYPYSRRVAPQIDIISSSQLPLEFLNRWCKTIYFRIWAEILEKDNLRLNILPGNQRHKGLFPNHRFLPAPGLVGLLSFLTKYGTHIRLPTSPF